MKRTISLFAILTSLLGTAPALAVGPDGGDDTTSDEAAAPDEDTLEDEGLEDEESYDEEEAEFCGGEEYSEIDDAFSSLENDRPADAEATIVDALRHGRIDASHRSDALALLAEAQLRQGEPTGAIVNFRHALRLAPESTQYEVGLAVALAARGMSEEAYRVARSSTGALCASRWAQSECYATQAVLAQSTRDEAERSSATHALVELRQAHPTYDADFDRVDSLLGGA